MGFHRTGGTFRLAALCGLLVSAGECRRPMDLARDSPVQGPSLRSG